MRIGRASKYLALEIATLLTFVSCSNNLFNTSKGDNIRQWDNDISLPYRDGDGALATHDAPDPNSYQSADSHPPLVGYAGNPNRETRIWDVMHLFDSEGAYYFQTSAWPIRQEWVQVPYNMTNYAFVGDMVIENGNFFLWVPRSRLPRWNANVAGTPGFSGSFYILKGNWDSANDVEVMKTIVVNTPDEVIIEREGHRLTTSGSVRTRFRAARGSGWVELEPMSQTDRVCIHSAPNRFAVAPANDSTENDFVVDPAYDPPENITYPLPNSANRLMVQQVVNEGTMWVLAYHDPSLASPTINTLRSGTDRLETICCNPHGQRMYAGVVNDRNVFHHEEVGASIAADGIYTSSFVSPVPGRWRMSGRVDGVYYTRDVSNGKFVFQSPVSGKLEVVLAYLLDRTASTPASVNTPMDIYRATVKR